MNKDLSFERSCFIAQKNVEIHNRIAQELDDLLFDFKEKHNLDIDFDTIDKIIEQIKTVALRRY